jgi:hypothetical protein
MVAADPRVNGVAGAANGTLPMIAPKTWIAELSVTDDSAKPIKKR